MKTLRKREVAEKLNVSIQYIDLMVRKGKFLKPFYLSPQLPLWDEADINAWLQAKKTGEDHGSEGKTESLIPA